MSRGRRLPTDQTIPFEPSSWELFTAMRPYLAIILDSFHEALASRVLWVLIVLITLVLLVLMPVGYLEVVSTGFRGSDLRDVGPVAFLEHLRGQAALTKPSPARHLVSLMDKGVRDRLDRFAQPKPGDMKSAMEFGNTIETVIKEIDGNLELVGFHNADAWKDVPQREELKELLDKDASSLSPMMLQRRNRLLLEAAFPEFIRVSPGTSLVFTYLHMKSEPLPISKAALDRLLKSRGQLALRWFVGAIGILVAVLVTSPLVPQTFDPGSLNLLLSKPISRSLLFLSKFVGGCAFILLNVSYLILGLWLLLGLRFNVWEPRFLYSIPVYVFVFAIYFSVSAITGLIWRSPIIAVAMAMLFFIACFMVGLTRWGFDTWYVNKQKVTHVFMAGDTLMSVNDVGHVKRWSGDEWERVCVSESQEQVTTALALLPALQKQFRPVATVHDASQDRLISVERTFPTQETVMTVGYRRDNWTCKMGVPAPASTTDILKEPDGSILLVSPAGVQRLVGDPVPRTVAVFQMKFRLPGAALAPATERVTLSAPSSAAVNPDTGELALYTRGTLIVLKRNEETKMFEETRQRVVIDDENKAVTLAFGGSSIVGAVDDGRVIVLDAATLSERKSFTPEGAESPRYVRVAPGGRWFATLFHKGTCWLYDADENRIERASFAGQGDVSGVSFSDDGQLFVATQGTLVSRYRLGTSLTLDERYTPRSTTIDLIYRYGVRPLHWCFPKPGELDQTFAYLLTGKATANEGEISLGSLSVSQTRLDPWGPVWSSAAFIGIVLAIACLYIERQEY